MKWFDRGLLLVLAVGVWALVFKPSSLNAHRNDEMLMMMYVDDKIEDLTHVCNFAGSVLGFVTDIAKLEEVVGYVRCDHN